MIAVIQRVAEANVKINGNVKSAIGQGFLILLGIAENDNQEDVNWLVNKIAAMRIFSDEEGKMNLNLAQVDGEILLVSQFTLHASTKKGNRPSFIGAAKPEIAVPLYQQMIKKLADVTANEIKTGEFGADMKIALINDGPVTILLDSKDRK